MEIYGHHMQNKLKLNLYFLKNLNKVKPDSQRISSYDYLSSFSNPLLFLGFFFSVFLINKYGRFEIILFSPCSY